MTRKRTTAIEWTEHTWNPFIGCSVHTAGCTNCYAMRAAAWLGRMKSGSVYRGTTKKTRGGPVWTGKIKRGSPATWARPTKLREPSIFFVNSMSDFFHAAAPDAWRLEALEIIASTPHQYQILTKRPEEMLAFVERTGIVFPRNAWLGVTVERADYVYRIDLLREAPAAIRWISAEPLIGPLGELDLEGVAWIVPGGESGPKARPCEADWVRELRDQAIAQDVALFFKQWGRVENNPLYRELVDAGVPEREAKRQAQAADPDGKGGSLLDGRAWKEHPPFEFQVPLAV